MAGGGINFFEFSKVEWFERISDIRLICFFRIFSFLSVREFIVVSNKEF